MTAQEFFSKLPERVDPAKTAGMNNKYVFDVEGAGQWTVAVEDGAVSVTEGAGDADCTIAECGDGTRNVAAGELCDSIVDTPGCDSDCTANVCGDGHVNAETEQCDDSNTAPGDGCSASCQRE